MQVGRFNSIAAAFAIALCFFAAIARAQAAERYGYKFEGPRFTLSLIEVDVAADGSGEVRFKRGESDEIIKLEFKLIPETLARIRQLYRGSQFLSSTEDYQSKKDFSHLGWKTLYARQGDQQREVRFNYTHNEAIEELAAIFRAIATQEMHLFDMDTAAQYQPLDLPDQLISLENDLRLKNIAEPERMLKALRELAGNDSLPLIARNHAGRIIAAIEKKKYKSPMKNQ
jgi:hypothetical protein